MSELFLPACPEGHTDCPDDLHFRFLSIAPRIVMHAEIVFRHLRCPGKREDAIAETLAVCWKWFLRATEQGKDVSQLAGALATFAARHVRSGRRLCGQEKSSDALSSLAQRKHSFSAQSLPAYQSAGPENPALEALTDNTETPPPDQAAFRIDYPNWLVQLGARNREIAQDMALSHSTQELANKHKVSPGRVSQLRRLFHEDWQRFHGEAV